MGKPERFAVVCAVFDGEVSERDQQCVLVGRREVAFGEEALQPREARAAPRATGALSPPAPVVALLGNDPARTPPRGSGWSPS